MKTRRVWRARGRAYVDRDVARHSESRARGCLPVHPVLCLLVCSVPGVAHAGGSAVGMGTAPLELDLTGSSFGAVPSDDPADTRPLLAYPPDGQDPGPSDAG